MNVLVERHEMWPVQWWRRRRQCEHEPAVRDAKVRRWHDCPDEGAVNGANVLTARQVNSEGRRVVFQCLVVGCSGEGMRLPVIWVGLVLRTTVFGVVFDFGLEE